MSDKSISHENHAMPSAYKEGGHNPNLLIKEKSPYLLQHAYNPVQWRPWGQEAFEKAKREDKPIFLSVGYSTCHWCHVMEKESFEDDEVAEVINRIFVPIKVDREERPDIDHIYMTACQMMTGSGGWPLTVIMTHDRQPFFAGSYFPKHTQHGRIGLIDLSERIEFIWRNERSKIEETTASILSALSQSREDSDGELLDLVTLKTCYENLSQRFDLKQGGFSDAPKFPTPHNLLFLLRYWKRSGDDKALQMVTKTLDEMRLGGIYDHVGFGFHRYSTDAKWLVPHFEKMLYDQAMLAIAYTEAYQATGNPDYMKTTDEIFEYVLRDLTSKEGAFYSAEDADSEGVEGKFYLWTLDEIRTSLENDEAALVEKVFNVYPMGNFKEEATQEITGTNILHLKRPLLSFSDQHGVSPSEDIETLWDVARRKLLKTREGRIRPYMDDKILTDWNGLMIAALARASLVFDNPKYYHSAARAADFILSNMRDSNGKLFHRYRQGESGLSAHIDDYSFFIWGLLELYEASFDPKYLKIAVELNADCLRRFWDDKIGGFFFTANDGEKLLVRQKEVYDGATPSGNSVAAMNILKISRFTGSSELESMASIMAGAFSSTVKKFPSAYTQFLLFVDFTLGPSFEIALVGHLESNDMKNIMTSLNKIYAPNKVLIFRTCASESPEILEIAPYLVNFEMINDKATIYVCRNYACETPTNDPKRMLSLLATN
jgi:uncharacterized protein